MDWREEVCEALENVPDAEVYFQDPEVWPEGTVITYACANEAPDEYAGDQEYQTEIAVKVDVWDTNPLKVWETTRRAKAALREIDYHMEFCADAPKINGHYHTTMRFITAK